MGKVLKGNKSTAMPTANLPLPPGPRSRSLLGSLPDLSRDRLGFLMHVTQQYGDVVKYRIASYQLVQVSHPDGIQQVLQENNHNYTKNSPTLREFRRVLGSGLFHQRGSFLAAAAPFDVASFPPPAHRGFG